MESIWISEKTDIIMDMESMGNTENMDMAESTSMGMENRTKYLYINRTVQNVSY